MIGQTFPILQSGFIAMDMVGLRKPEIIEPTLREAVIFKETKQPLTRYYYSQEVTDLYASWCANRNALREFDFRERLLKAAFNAFNCTSFVRWLEVQQDKPKFSDLHAQFLLETIEYIVTGKERTISATQWSRLLEASEKTHRVKVDLTKHFGNGELNQPAMVPNSLEHIVSLWVMPAGGFEDLLMTLFVIFGSRGGVTEISNATRA